MRVDLAGKVSTLFELELAAQVCRDLSEIPGWGQKVLIPGTEEYQEYRWSVTNHERLADTIQAAVPRIVRRQTDRSLGEVLHGSWSERRQQTHYEIHNFGDIWVNTQRIGDWIVLKSRAERLEAVSILLMTCRSFLWDVSQRKFEGELPLGAPYHIDEAWRELLANSSPKFEQLNETECKCLMPMADEWFRLCGH
jgi:hypothetical protein